MTKLLALLIVTLAWIPGKNCRFSTSATLKSCKVILKKGYKFEYVCFSCSPSPHFAVVLPANTDTGCAFFTSLNCFKTVFFRDVSFPVREYFVLLCCCFFFVVFLIFQASAPFAPKQDYAMLDLFCQTSKSLLYLSLKSLL